MVLSSFIMNARKQQVKKIYCSGLCCLKITHIVINYIIIKIAMRRNKDKLFINTSSEGPRIGSQSKIESIISRGHN